METLGALVPLLVFLAVSSVGIALYFQFSVSESALQQQRLATYGQAARTVKATVDGRRSLLKQKDYSTIPLVQRLLRGARFAENMAVDLAAAGVPLRVGEYLFIRWLISVTLGGVGLIVLQSPVLAVVLGVFGFFVPKFYIQRKQQMRLNRFNDQLVDALTMMANALKSGSSFLQAMGVVADEMSGPISEEFSQVLSEVSVGAPLDTALQDLTQRMKGYDLYLVITAILIQRQAGGNLSEVLENIAHTIRERLRLKRQVMVLTAEQRFSAYIVGGLPIFIMVILAVLNPGYHRPFIEQPLGKILLVSAGTFELLGLIVMRRMARIEV